MFGSHILACLVHGLHSVCCLFQGSGYMLCLLVLDWGEMKHEPSGFFKCIQCLWVLSLRFVVFQLCVCGVWTHNWKCTQSSLSVFTMLGTAVWSSLHSAVVVLLWNSPSIFTRTHLANSWLWQVWANSPVFTNLPIDLVQLMPRLHHIQSTVDTSVKLTNTRTLPY